MSYGTPRAILSDGAIRCIKCALMEFALVPGDDVDESKEKYFVRMVDKHPLHYTEEPLYVVREGQNQDFLVESYCEDCNRDLEADCTDY